MNIRPVSDLRNKYPEVENMLRESGEIYLTKNGYGTAVLMRIEKYAELTGQMLSPHVVNKVHSESERGFLKKYADPSRISQEKNAGRIHAMKKFGGKIDE